MIKNILWKGLAAESLEHCSIYYKDLIRVRSSIIGHRQYLPFKMDYEIELDQDWVIRSFLIKSSLFNMDQTLSLRHDGYGKWYGDSKEWKTLEGCMDIDISVSPFTNTLPINRIKPAIGDSNTIDVVYIDIPGFRITKEQQQYIRIGSNTYHFSNAEGDFRADIQVDDAGLVVRYPGLFERVLLRE
jgi:hypothetical protein